MKILFVGPQGSGKSTQAKLLSKYLKLPFISTGDAFRELATQDSPEAEKVRKVLETGRLVDDLLTSQIVQKKLAQSEYQNGFILDGYPRTFAQVKLFDPGFDKVFYLYLQDETAKKRLLVRERVDDTPELVAERLRIYHTLTDPIVGYYKNLGVLQEINADQSIEDIQMEIREVVDG